MLKQGITTTVDVPDHPGSYTGATHATKFRYKAELTLYNKYKEHMRNSIKALTSCFTKRLLMDLENDSEVIEFTPIEIYENIKTNFLLPRGVSREITKLRQDLRVAYEPDEIVQKYYKKLHTATFTLAALCDPVVDIKIMRYAFETFKLQSDLKEACRDWDRRPVQPLATWTLIKNTSVSKFKEIKRTHQHSTNENRLMQYLRGSTQPRKNNSFNRRSCWHKLIKSKNLKPG